jgi:hypothetical protein
VAPATLDTVAPTAVLAPWRTVVDERAARRALRGQIAQLEARLTDAVASSFPLGGIATYVPYAGGPRLLSLAELERQRDALAQRIAEAHALLDRRGREQEAARALLERMLLDPGRHRRVRISQRELGEGGCGVWRVEPRVGLLGRLMGWWQVKLSSGCPLAT